MSARDEVLARIRGALGDAPGAAPDVPRSYRRTGEHPPGSAHVVEQLVDRLEDYRATVLRSAADDESVGAAVASALAAVDATSSIAAPGVPDAWTSSAPGCRRDDGSATARDLLESWPQSASKFVKVTPTEYRKALQLYGSEHETAAVAAA